MNLRPIYRTSAMALALWLPMAATAQDKSSANANDGITARYVKTGLFVLSGEGGNSVLRLSANGLILVDGELPGNFTVLLRHIRKIDKQPLRVLVLTSGDEARFAANKDFLASGAPVIVQQNGKLSLASVQAATDKAPPATNNKTISSGDDDAPSPSGNHSPGAVVTYDREYKIHLGGVDVQLMHFGNAYSSSDTVVYFPNLKVVAVGDLYSAKPTPDFAAGGSLVGWGAVLAQVLKLDFDVAIPSTGPAITRADLEAFKTKIDTMVSRATGLVKQGVPKDQLMAQLKTADLGWQLSFSGDQLDSFYADLSQTK